MPAKKKKGKKGPPKAAPPMEYMDNPHWVATLLEGFTARQVLVEYLDFVCSK